MYTERPDCLTVRVPNALVADSWDGLLFFGGNDADAPMAILSPTSLVNASSGEVVPGGVHNMALALEEAAVAEEGGTTTLMYSISQSASHKAATYVAPALELASSPLPSPVEMAGCSLLVDDRRFALNACTCTFTS